jgi:uncharacterized protein YegL
MRAEGKMQALNDAIREAIPAMQQVSLDYPQATIFVNAIRFGDDARWMVERLTPLSEFRWHDLEPGGLTALGEALTVVGETLQAPLIRGRALPPILVLVTDGLPTDDFQAGLNHLLSRPWGRQSMRLAVMLGRDPEVQSLLQAFISSEAPAPLQATSAETLAGQLRWAAITALKAVCAPDTVKEPVENPAAAAIVAPNGEW